MKRDELISGRTRHKGLTFYVRRHILVAGKRRWGQQALAKPRSMCTGLRVGGYRLREHIVVFEDHGLDFSEEVSRMHCIKQGPTGRR